MMKLSYLFAAALLLGAHSLSGQATVLISCYPGANPVQSAGIHINDGVVEILDDACQSSPGGDVLPPPLVVNGPNVSPATVAAGGTATYSASIANFLSPHSPGATTYDSCVLQLRRNDAVVASAPVPALTASFSISFTVPAVAVNGAHSAVLVCQRWVESQQIVVPEPVAATFNVTQTTQPTSCNQMTAPFTLGYERPYQTEFGAPITQGHPWHTFSLSNTWNSGQLTSVNVAAFSFQAPSNHTGTLRVGSTTAHYFTYSLSTQCGEFVNVPTACRYTGPSGRINWTTQGTPGICQLVPGETYYLNTGSFKFNGSAVDATYNPECVCAGPNCTATCAANIINQN